MSKCLSCYKELDENQVDYHPKCLMAFYGTKHAPILPYRLTEIEKLAKEAAELSISVPGVQPKLSLGWIKTELEAGHQGRLTILDALDGNYILKPQNADYPQMPENEHLSMKLAELFKINIVPVNMIRLQSGELCFITKRIDRNPDGSKNHMIDFLQILELSDKYKGTKETLGKTIGDLSINTLFDKLRFFESTVFNYIIGNNDMHLKNHSMFLSGSGWVLSPFYDFLNVKLILPCLSPLIDWTKIQKEFSTFQLRKTWQNRNGNTHLRRRLVSSRKQNGVVQRKPAASTISHPHF